MNILLLGSGGREHAMAWKITDSPLCKKLYTAPGNAGTLALGENVSLAPDDFEKVADFIADNHISMVVVGPEDPLVKGIADFLTENVKTRHVMVIGPSKAGSMLEGSKKFAKEFMHRHQIPTAAYKSFTADTLKQGVEFLQALKPPYVLKADGLAAGKGVLILHDYDAAVEGLKGLLLEKSFGKASEKVVIEEFLDGIEVSVFIATDGKNWVMLPQAKDYKRIGENDQGPNTGGMGAVSPVPFADNDFMDKVVERIVKPTIKGIEQEKLDYKGFIFLGLMNVNGDPYVIEYNVRLGDPETEAILPRINSDFVELLKDIATENLNNYTLEICPHFCAAFMLVSGGYPGAYEKDKRISGTDRVQKSHVFYAGAKQVDENIYTAGGRVLAVSSLHSSLQKALENAISDANMIDFEKKYFRTDIGKDLM
ncbi:MAG: phosphoribosylamine--glycine ligase [Bacteroidales bacterium]